MVSTLALLALCTALAAALPWLIMALGRTLVTGRYPAETRIDAIDALLPQTQCSRCGYAGCIGYARALTQGAPIHRCPPGGTALIARLAQAMDTPLLAPDPARNHDFRLEVAQIREDSCIGCTKCIQVCPTAAIVGAHASVHTVVADACTGCLLCVPACPVDCIDMVPDASQQRAADGTYHERRRQLERHKHHHLKRWTEAWKVRTKAESKARTLPVMVDKPSQRRRAQLALQQRLTRNAAAQVAAADKATQARFAAAMDEITSSEETDSGL